jgi:sec-independent protein translocase protein TatA
MQIGPMEILVILVIALLIFGPNKLPEMARTVGRGVREVRRFQRMVQGELEDVMSEPAPNSGRSTTARETKPVETAEAVEAASGDTTSGNGVSGNGASADGGGNDADGEVRSAEPASDPVREPD